MEITLQKTATLTFDTAMERKRIAKAFKDRKYLQKKLYKLMDLIEQEKWTEALNELRGKWWQDHDKLDECPRLEYIGMIHHDSPFFSHGITYIDVVINMCDSPDNYKIISKKLDADHQP